MNIKNAVIIIPSLNPGKKLVQYIDNLIHAGYSRLIIVDDGSNEETQSIFDEIEQKKQCKVLKHMVNMGKGRALKDAFNYYLAWQKREGFVGG